MTRNLETVIRALADAGNFSHLSIISSGKGFHASFSPAASWGRGMAEHSDPVEAIMLAIDAAPKEGKGKKVHPPVHHTEVKPVGKTIVTPVSAGHEQCVGVQANEPLTEVTKVYPPAVGTNHPARSTVVDIPVVGGPQQANAPETYMVESSYELIPVEKPKLKEEKQDGLGTILHDVAGVGNSDILPIDVTAPVTDLMNLFKNEDNDD